MDPMAIWKKKETAGAADGAVAVQQPASPNNRKRIVRIVVIVVIAAVLIAIAASLFSGKSKGETNTATYTEYTVGTQDITTELSYSGTLEPADSYTVTSLVSGEILTADFEEGDTVKKDDVLYVVDSSDATTGLERAENTLDQAERNYQQTQESLADLNVKATASGQVVDLQVEVGDEVAAGQTIALLRNSSTMTIELPFPADEAASFTVGQAAQVTVDGSFETISGTVTAVSAADTVLSGNRIVRNVEITVQNPGAITSATTATATVGTSACAQSGTFAYAAEKTITAKVGGEVSSILVSEGDTVSEGQTLVALSSETLQNQLESAADQVEDAQLSLDSQQDALDGYTLQSPIDGTIVDKYYKQGDNLESGKQLCTIFDLSYLTFTMNVDELDIAQVKVGQKVTITAEALEGQTFEGEVTKVSINGTTTGGVTSYPVTVRIDETDGLLPGMNVDASVVVSESLDAVSVPVEAVSRGNLVLKKTDSETAYQEGNEEGIPAGYEYVEVTLGNSNDDFIEVLSGLEPGDEIAYIPASAAGSTIFDAMGMGMAGGDTMVVEATEMPAGGPGGGGGGMGGGPGGGF